MYENDNRIVLTLDAGGTNFVFSAMRGGREAVAPLRVKAVTDNIEKCLETIAEGFRRISDSIGERPAAISFAFPGPADYRHGVIGRLPNFPAFSGGGTALGPWLEKIFKIPVFINNDGNLYAYGEALCGFLPEINEKLHRNGSRRQYRNLLGITFGTGFGAGVVIDDRLLTGDNGCGGDVWCMQNVLHPDMIAEEGVSIRAVRRIYEELSGESAAQFNPKDIYDIADGIRPGNRQAAVETFMQFGRTAGNAIAHAIDIVDGLVVIGGGVSGAAKYIFPGILAEMRSSLSTFAGASFPRLQSEVYDLTDPSQLASFLDEGPQEVTMPFSDEKVPYFKNKRIGVGLSSIGTSEAIAAGAYAYALSRLDEQL